MTLDQALKRVDAYEAERREVRSTLLAFLRRNPHTLDEMEYRKVQRYPADLSDARLARLVRRTR